MPNPKYVETGRKGGKATLARYGRAHFAQLARKMIAKHGTLHLSAIGHKGGETYVRKYVSGPSYWTEDGSLGG